MGRTLKGKRRRGGTSAIQGMTTGANVRHLEARSPVKKDYGTREQRIPLTETQQDVYDYLRALTTSPDPNVKCDPILASELSVYMDFPLSRLRRTLAALRARGLAEMERQGQSNGWRAK